MGSEYMSVCVCVFCCFFVSFQKCVCVVFCCLKTCEQDGEWRGRWGNSGVGSEEQQHAESLIPHMYAHMFIYMSHTHTHRPMRPRGRR